MIPCFPRGLGNRYERRSEDIPLIATCRLSRLPWKRCEGSCGTRARLNFSFGRVKETDSNTPPGFILQPPMSQSEAQRLFSSWLFVLRLESDTSRICHLRRGECPCSPGTLGTKMRVERALKFEMRCATVGVSVCVCLCVCLGVQAGRNPIFVGNQSIPRFGDAGFLHGFGRSGRRLWPGTTTPPRVTRERAPGRLLSDGSVRK